MLRKLSVDSPLKKRPLVPPARETIVLIFPELMSKYVVVVVDLWFDGWLSISLGVRATGCCSFPYRVRSAKPAVKSSRADDGEIKLRLSDVSKAKMEC